MDVIKTARELGKAIQQDERFIRFAKARLANDNLLSVILTLNVWNLKKPQAKKKKMKN